jgi:ATP-binding cassette, subfamily B, bacterial MsbA
MLDKFISRANTSLIARLLSENFKEQAPWYGIAIAAMLVVAAMTSASAWIMRDIVNETVVSKDLNRVFGIAIAVAVIFAVKGIATYIQTVFLSRAGNNIIAQTQKKLFRSVLNQSIGFYSKFASSELLMRITNNAQAARNVMDLIVTSFVRDLFSLLGLIAVMVIQQPMLSLISAVIGPVAIFGVRRLSKKVRKIMEQEMVSLGGIIRNVQETSTGIMVV